MKKKNRIVSYLAAILSILSVAVSFQSMDLNDVFKIDWSIMSWMLLAIAVFCILSAILSSYLMMQRHRILNVYISCPHYGEKEIMKLKETMNSENVVLSTDVPVGTDEKEIKKLISRSHVCFLAVGHLFSTAQKEEYKEMRKQGKNVFLVAIDEKGDMPGPLRDRKPLYINDESLTEKVDEILMEYK